MARQIFQHQDSKKLFVQRNFDKTRFYEVALDGRELVHLDSRSKDEHDVTKDGLKKHSIHGGIERYV